MTAITLPKTNKKIPISIFILSIIAVLGLYSMGIRWIHGLGIATNLSDTRPWGLWISFDLAVMAFSGSAFTLAAVTHMFHRHKYENIARVVLISGFVGYISAAAALTVELGRPERLWHYFFYWNPHSPLFEVGLCVISYLIILTLEFLPIVFKKMEWFGALRVIHFFEIPIVAAGIILSSGHQSSLGSISLVFPYKLHPLWYSPLLPLIFFVSAMTAGFAMAIAVGLLGKHFFKDWYFKPGTFTGLGKYLLAFLTLTLLLKMGELAYANELNLIFENSNQGKMFLIENGLGYILPIIILLVPKFRSCNCWLFRASILAVIGLVIHRINVSLVGLAGASYYPTWQEVLSTAGLFSIGVVLFWLVATNFSLMEEPKPH